MKLQISFDLVELEKALAIADQVVNQCDILDIGTILLYRYGLEAIRAFRNQFPKKTLLIDSKLLERADPSIELFAQAGADWITVMAGTPKETLHNICKEASKYNLKVSLDLRDAASPAQSALEAKNIGADALLFHMPYKAESSLIFLDKWQMIKGNASLPIFISAHIDRKIFDNIIALNPYAVVIGNSIVNAKDPAQEAKYYYDIVSKDR